MTDPATNTAVAVANFVGSSLLSGKTIPEIVAELDGQLAELRKEFAIASVSTLTSPQYSVIKAAADVLRKRC